jgi:hypothetical protein
MMRLLVPVGTLKMKYWRQFIVIFCLLDVGIASAKELDKRSITTKFGFAVPTLEIKTAPKPEFSSGAPLTFKPNYPTKTFLSFGYGIYGVSVSLANPIAEDRSRLYGDSKATDFQFRFYLEKISIEAAYQSYQGYYIDNTEVVDPAWNGSLPRRLYPDLTTQHVGLNLNYIFSPDSYSQAAVFNHSEIQTESGGSWIVGASFSAHQLNNPTPMIPQELSSSYGEFGKVKGMDLNSLSLYGGGGYNLVFFENLYFTFQSFLGLSTQSTAYTKTDSSAQDSSSGTKFNTKLGFGYNSEKFIIGAAFINDASTYTMEKVDTTFSTIEFSIFAGTRFKF